MVATVQTRENSTHSAADIIGGFLTRRIAGGNRDGNNIVGKFEISGEILAETSGDELPRNKP